MGRRFLKIPVMKISMKIFEPFGFIFSMLTVTENIPTPKIVNNSFNSSIGIFSRNITSDILVAVFVGIIMILLGVSIRKFRLNRIRGNRLLRSAS